MPESLLTILKLCLVAVLYLFFFRVLRAVWAELHSARAANVPPPPVTARPTGSAPKPRTTTVAKPAPTSTPTSLTVMAGLPVGTRFALDADELTVGRGTGCAVRLDDPTVSSIHARVNRRGSTFMIEDLGSRNGTFINRRRITAATPLRPGDRLGIGPNVELELA